MNRSPIRRIAALPLTLAVVGVALMALAALPANETEQNTAQASTDTVVESADID